MNFAAVLMKEAIRTLLTSCNLVFLTGWYRFYLFI